MSSLLTRAALTSVLALSTALAASLTLPAPFQGQVPSGWSQRALPSQGPGAVLIALTAPSKQAALVVTAVPLGRPASAQDLRQYIAGVEETSTGNGAATLKFVREQPRTVGGIKGVERVSLLTFKAAANDPNGTLSFRAWYGAGPKYIYQFELTAQRSAPARLTGAYEQFLKTVRFR